jgi:hypothetical protein
MATPSDAINYAESDLWPYKVFAIVDDKGVIWWRVKDDSGGWTDMFECSVGDRKMHIDELAKQ